MSSQRVANIKTIMDKCPPRSSKIYMDNNAASMISFQVLREMEITAKEFFGNPSSLHADGVRASALLESMRARLGELIGAESPSQIVFTSGGTESNNIVIRNVMDSGRSQAVMLVSQLEHSSVIETAKHACKTENVNYKRVFEIPVTSKGYVSLDALKSLCDEYGSRVALVCTMLGQNELGTLQPIIKICEEVRKRAPNALISVDVTQYVGKYQLTPELIGFPDFMTSSAHKFHGPRGVGFIYARDPRHLKSGKQQSGGGQEKTIRSGTEDLSAIVGMVTALDIAVSSVTRLAARQKYVSEMRDYIKQRLSYELSGIVQFNGDPDWGMYNTLNMTFLGPMGVQMAKKLDEVGISVSAGSACSKGKPSRVLLAIGKPPDEHSSTIRLSLSEYNTMDECIKVVDAIERIITGIGNDSHSDNCTSCHIQGRTQEFQKQQAPLQPFNGGWLLKT